MWVWNVFLRVNNIGFAYLGGRRCQETAENLHIEQRSEIHTKFRSGNLKIYRLKCCMCVEKGPAADATDAPQP
jgi:hypothetical protein